jgi:hypothetical protein
MDRRYDAFVIFAEMRTGSNHLEESLNGLADIRCHGELFNPVFIGRHNQFEAFGFDMARREREPLGLVDAMIAENGPLPGFRFFHDHDPRVLDRVLTDPRIAKVLLTRNPLDSYVSRKIATATGQWRLTDLKHAKTDRITFDAGEFGQMLSDWAGFRDTLRHGLQVTGQTAFHIRYDDINDVDILNGLARFLGSGHRLETASKRLKRQNPGEIRDKVENAAEMEAALARIDRFGLDRITDGEVPRAPGVPGFVAHPDAGLLFLPVAGAPVEPVLDWMAGIGGAGRADLLTGMTQKDLRKWMRTHPGFASFSLVRHPLLRVLHAYRDLQQARDARDVETRDLLSERHKIDFTGPPLGAMPAFVAALKGSLTGQDSVRTRADWATQAALLQAAAPVVLPQRIIRERDAATELAHMANAMGLEAPGWSGDAETDEAWRACLADHDLPKAVFDAYRKDFIQFGFSMSEMV